MQLPEDKNERIKVLSLIGIGVAATIYIIVRYGVQPMIKSNAENTKRIKEITTILNQVEQDVARLAEDSRQNTEALTKITDVSRKYILHPSLGGNYELNARQALEEIINKAEIKLTEKDPKPQVLGIKSAIQGASLPADSDLKNFAVRLSFNCGIRELRRIIETIRQINPYIAVSDLNITARAKTPAKHAVSFTLSWPIWAQPSMRDKVEERFQKETAEPETEGGE